VKIHYGTSRYCNRFMQGLDCTVRSCYFNHQLREKHEHKELLAETVGDQFQRAYALIEANLPYFVQKEYQEFKNRDRFEDSVMC
jgi:hypothetical protein